MLSSLASFLVTAPFQAPEFQTFEGMEIKTNLAFTERQVSLPGVQVWSAQAEAASSQLATQVILVVTDLRKGEKKLTPEEVCAKHEAAERSRRGFAGQLLKAERTTLGKNPMVVITGSSLTKDGLGRASFMYQASAAVVKGDFAYELSWITRDPSGYYQKALDACRTMSFMEGGQRVSPKAVIGAKGNYTIAGAPFGFKLPFAATPETTVFIGPHFSQRYKAKLITSDWIARLDTAVLKPGTQASDPTEVFKLFGYTEFLPKENPPKPVNKEGVWVYEGLPLSEKVVARVEVGFKEGQAACILVTAEKEKGLPARELLALQPLSKP